MSSWASTTIAATVGREGNLTAATTRGISVAIPKTGAAASDTRLEGGAIGGVDHHWSSHVAVGSGYKLFLLYPFDSVKTTVLMTHGFYYCSFIIILILG